MFTLTAAHVQMISRALSVLPAELRGALATATFGALFVETQDPVLRWVWLGAWIVGGLVELWVKKRAPSAIDRLQEMLHKQGWSTEDVTEFIAEHDTRALEVLRTLSLALKAGKVNRTTLEDLLLKGKDPSTED